MDDKSLRNHVLAELDFDPSIQSADIAVTVHNSIVTLAGHVPNLIQKLAAKDAALRVKGVRAVVQEIEVLPPQEPQSEADLAERAANVLSWASALPKDAIGIEVSQGVVTLTGEVDWDYQRRIAEQEIRSLAGVLDVRNLVMLKFHRPPSDIDGRIREALSRAGSSMRDVRVAVDEAAVALTGSVSNWFDSDLAERAAWSVPGVRTVENLLVILGDPRSEDLVA